MDPQAADTLLRFGVPIATFAFGTIISAQRNAASDAVVTVNELIADLKELQDHATEYWVNDSSHERNRINEARLRGLTFAVSAIVSQGLQLTPKDQSLFFEKLDEIIDLTTGSTFESHNRAPDFSRAVDIRNKTAELIYLSRRERSRRNAPFAILGDPIRWALRSKPARILTNVATRIASWPRKSA